MCKRIILFPVLQNMSANFNKGKQTLDGKQRTEYKKVNWTLHRRFAFRILIRESR